jgi:hypothetical protein
MNQPSSAATVTTVETLPEATLAICSLLHFYGGLPIFVACPPEIASKVAGIAPSVRPVPVPLHVPDSVEVHNGFHRSDAILLKMDAMEAALRHHPDTLFFDADLVFLNGINLPAGDYELLLSFNIAETNDMGVTACRYGLFNAGLLWTSAREFPDWWRHHYLNPTQAQTFYEQTCLSLAPAAFRTSYFSNESNYGFWRGPLGKRPTPSIHCHMSDILKMDPWMRSRVLPLRRAVIQRIPEPLLPVLRETCQHPKRVFFIHYGKAGGVYSNIAFKNLLRGYQFFDSWVIRPGGEARDWKREELETILTRPEGELCYLHQHHSNLCAADVELALKNGWKTVMFYRDPREIICSLYHWGSKITAETGHCPVFEEPSPHPVGFGAFFERITLPKWRYKWALPWWSGMVEHLHPFSPQSLDRVCESMLGAVHMPHGDLNASTNPGWESCLLPEHLSVLEAIPCYQRSMEWLQRANSPLIDPDTPLPIGRLFGDAA